MKKEYWNRKFSDVTKSIAFNLQLSKPQCIMLMKLIKRDKFEEQGDMVMGSFEFGQPLVALERKGLIDHDGENYQITKAGHLVSALLFLAFEEEEINRMCKVNTITIQDTKVSKKLRDMLDI